MLISEEIKPVVMAIIELHLSEGISMQDSQSVSRKFCLIRFFKNYIGGRVYGQSEDIFELEPMLPECHYVNIKLF